jgi:hypothetical protein
MKIPVFWQVAPCRSCVNRRFGGTALHFRRRHSSTVPLTEVFLSLTQHLLFSCIVDPAYGLGIFNFTCI